MTWYQDLDCSIYGDGSLKAVGWLSRGHDFPTGEVTTGFFTSLCELLVNPWCPVASGGCHECEFCRFTGGSGVGKFRDFRISGRSSSILYVPANGFIFFAPSSIAHYIDAHGYQPPEEFCEAVLHCPPMRSVAYLKAILHNGGRHLVQQPPR